MLHEHAITGHVEWLARPLTPCTGVYLRGTRNMVVSYHAVLQYSTCSGVFVPRGICVQKHYFGHFRFFVLGHPPAPVAPWVVEVSSVCECCERGRQSAVTSIHCNTGAGGRRRLRFCAQYPPQAFAMATNNRCDLSAYRKLTFNNTSPRRVIIVDAWPHTGIGHSLRAAALWLRYVSAVAPDRALRFAMCVPPRLVHAFSESEHEVPSCMKIVWDEVAKKNVSAVRFDMHRHLGLANLKLRAQRVDWADMPRGWRPDDAPRSCRELRARVSSTAKVVVLYGSQLRDMIGGCTEAAANGVEVTENGLTPLPRTGPAAFGCLRHVHAIGAAADIALPPCDLGLHLRSMRLDDRACDLLSAAPPATATQPATSTCAFAWRARRCPTRSLGQLAACAPRRSHPAAPTTRLFATADAPHLYATTRPLGWADLGEEASVTWNERRNIAYPAQLGDVARTAAAFVALARCRKAIVAPVVSHFSETASYAAGVPLVGCCEEVLHLLPPLA